MAVEIIIGSVQKYIGLKHVERKGEENKSVEDLSKCIDLQENIKNTFKEKFEKMVEKHGNIEQKVYRMLGKRK